MQKKNAVTEILVLVTPHFNLAATMAFLDPFRAANYLAGRQLFENMGSHVSLTTDKSDVGTLGTQMTALALPPAAACWAWPKVWHE